MAEAEATEREHDQWVLAGTMTSTSFCSIPPPRFRRCYHRAISCDMYYGALQLVLIGARFGRCHDRIGASGTAEVKRVGAFTMATFKENPTVAAAYTRWRAVRQLRHRFRPFLTPLQPYTKPHTCRLTCGFLTSAHAHVLIGGHNPT